MSSPTKDSELKAGHAPAVKAGGMRVVTKGHAHSSSTPEKNKQESPEAPAEAAPPEDSGPLLVSGAVAKGHKDFPKEAVKAYHEKPLPHAEKRPNPATHHHIQQPQRR